MAYYIYSVLLTSLIIIIITPHFISATPPTYSPPPNLQPEQLNNIIDALIGAGDFSSWTSVLSDVNSSTLPFTVTLFIPDDDALAAAATDMIINFDPFIFPYHIVPQRLSFLDLQLLKLNTRLPTLLLNKSIIITNNSRYNFTIDDSPITHPDLYITAGISVHGIGAILDYALYGGNGLSLVPGHQPSPAQVVSRPPPNIIGEISSGAACSCIEFPIVLLFVCAAAFAFKINRNHI